jgi:glutamate/aspartate transport system permease protein
MSSITEIIIKNWPILWHGFLTTSIITIFSAIFGFILGFILMIVSLKEGFLSKVVKSYIFLIRGLPLLILILTSYTFLTPIFQLLSFLGDYKVICGIVTISFFASAYFSEILKSNYSFINLSQIDSAKSLGLSKIQTYKDIILPQVFKKAKNPLIKQAITLFNESSLIYIIGVNDFFGVAKKIGERTNNVVDSMLIIAVVYVIISLFFQKVIMRNKV